MDPVSIEALRQISFFSELSDFDLGQIAGITEQKSYRRGEAIIEERTAAERFFIIMRGKIEISKRFEDGEQFVLAVHSDGEFFGEMALLDQGLRSATVRAVEPTTVLEITRPNFETLLYKAPLLAFRILRELSSRLRETGALLVSYLERRNRELHRAYLQSLSAFLLRAQPYDAERQSRAQRLRTLTRRLGEELGLLEEELLSAEIGVILDTLQVPSSPPLPPLQPGSRALRIGAVVQAFEELTGGRYAKPARGSGDLLPGLRKRSGERFDPQAAEALLRLWREGQLTANH
jgi:CRP-like cAMP-binding protein